MAEQTLSLDQRLGMRLSQQQLRFVRLLEMSAPELDEAVERELEENPALEPADADTARDSGTSEGGFLPLRRHYDSDSQQPEFAPADTTVTLLDYLTGQLAERTLPLPVEEGARYIIGNLDGNGYLRRPLRNLLDDLEFNQGVHISPADGEEALRTVQELDPTGVGATSLQECLLLQLRRMPGTETTKDAIRIIDENFETFTLKHSKKLESDLGISKERVSDALKLILSLNPKPGNAFDSSSSEASNIIIPDFIIGDEDGELTISLNNRIPELRIDQGFASAVADMEISAAEKKGKGKKDPKNQFILTRYNDARDFIRILTQRQKIMMLVMTAIVKYQKEYFETEDVYRLRPMMIKDLAEMTGLDLSVISRATASKYVSTSAGIFPLRFFFSDKVGEENGSDTEALTNRKVEAEIKALVDEEDKEHPLSDEKLRQEMQKRGYDISRRTVAKYRDRIGIPVARLRREL